MYIYIYIYIAWPSPPGARHWFAWGASRSVLFKWCVHIYIYIYIYMAWGLIIAAFVYFADWLLCCRPCVLIYSWGLIVVCCLNGCVLLVVQQRKYTKHEIT